MLVDTHCHLNFSAFDGDREEILDRARQAGITGIVNPGIDLQTSREVVKLAQDFQEVFAAVGIHPNDASTWNDLSYDSLTEIASHPKVIAIGEIGLDYYWDRSPVELQKEIFRKQLRIASELELPVIIHVRNKTVEDHLATQDMYTILKEWIDGLREAGSILFEKPGVLHSFSDDSMFADKFILLNFWIGITGPITFRNARILQNVVESIPLEKILLETDSPFLTPHPYRGKRNEPAYVRYTANKVAEIKGLSEEIVYMTTTTNAGRLFSW